jgi:hypothetical protein
MRSTNAVEMSIQAVVPVSTAPGSAPKAKPAGNRNKNAKIVIFSERLI